MTDLKNITIFGAGSWGTTLAVLLESKGFNITLWEKFPEYCKVLQEKRENIKFLPGIKIPESIKITSDIKDCVCNTEMFVLAMPSHVVREFLVELKCYCEPEAKQALFVSVIKGIENKTLFRVSQIVKDVLGDVPFISLSGPTHAEEVAKKLPAAMTACSLDINSAKIVQNVFAAENLRIYTNTDVIGVELGGSLKNIIAISAGISDGLGFGDNTKAALLTRGLAEIIRLGSVLGAEESTFYGLTGIGDLITTCTSEYGRNRKLGLRLANGESLKEILDSMEMVAEGVRATESAYELASEYSVDMPIVNEMYEVLFKNKNPKDAVKDLMSREYKQE
jgi:glycerol-3-phosphate dehydrogenase (NAD(P)+)